MIAIAEADLPERFEGEFLNTEEIREASFDAFDLDVAVVHLETDEDISDKIISYIEKMIRKSNEYRAYINYLKNELNLSKCSLLEGLDVNEAKFSLEFHHFPLNLFEITSAVVRKKLDELKEDETLSCFDVADTVMQEHYKNKIGLVPLSATLHKMAHNKSIIIPYSKIYGKYEEFMKEYGEYLPDEVKERIMVDRIANSSKDVENYNQDKLRKIVTNFKIDYEE